MTTARTANVAPQSLLLQVDGISKWFPGQRALEDVSLAVRAGEVLALLGENGSGKSTLIKILAGFHHADTGSITLAPTPGNGDGAGRIRFIHQDLALVDSMSVLDNLALGRGYHRRGFRIDWSAEVSSAREALAPFDPTINIYQTAGSLQPAQRTVVAIARALEGWTASGGVLVLDEPTASLPPNEVDVLLQAIRTIAGRGAGVIFVSHHLEDVFAVADRAYVLRNGRVVGERDVADCSRDDLVTLITGRPPMKEPLLKSRPTGDVVLSARDLRTRSLKGASFDLHEGEILGVTGLVGSGHDELCGALFGAAPLLTGTVAIDDARLSPLRPRNAKAHGLAFVPADRASHACNLIETIRANMTITDLRSVSRYGRIDTKAERRDVWRWTHLVGLSTNDGDRAMSTLSGGNQQKVVLARWLRRKPRVYLMHEPTQGVDVGARREILGLLGDAVSDGSAALVCSSNAGELTETCHRVLVMQGGRIVAEFHGPGIDPAEVGASCYGLADTRVVS